MKNYSYNYSYITAISIVAALGGYLFGFDFAVIAGGLPFLQKYFGLNTYWEGLATGSMALGAITGCLIAGILADKIGRKSGLLVAAAVFLLSSLAMGLAPSANIFIASRYAAGIGVGMASMLSPLYIAEIAPAAYRGRLMAINQLTMVLGIFITNLVNYSLRNIGPDAWRWMFGLGAVPSLVFLIGVFILPESPRWLLLKNRHARAAAVYTKIGNTSYARDMIHLFQAPAATSSSLSLLLNKKVWPVLFTGITLAVFQQFCGINTVFNYTPKLFERIGASADSQLLQTVFIGVVNLAFTIIAMLLVDKVGRKPLMLFGAAALSIVYLFIVQLLGAKNPDVAWLLLAAIGIYAMTLAPVTWILIAEIFPDNIRTTATTIAILFLWTAYFILVVSFPVLFQQLGDKTFYLYGFICLLGALFILKFVRETKGKLLGGDSNAAVMH
ncbi:sugar porter family MFS transporter [Chitinophaga arvensicola]|uniref:MFS transporter, sugar porter (SP) family n=1 Tax=Chitinophaga arvensicola TaxID=29529 RepID=A0A1I0S7F9_9BACT|nr:sugar porter family MFS transporter [Chitinophaga arvensicola]SEW51547.1 MFS transporter, sugar porter (SP) family [Chitinophaga arvensicola]